MTPGIVAYGDHGRVPPVQRHVRDALYGIIERCLERARPPFHDCHHEDRGDGVIIVVPPKIDSAILTPDSPNGRAPNRTTATRSPANA